MSFYTDKSPFPDDENESQVSGMDMLSAGSRRYSGASTDSRMSEVSARGRRFSTLANQVIQVERSRRASRSFSSYKSPYSKVKTMQDSLTPMTNTREMNKPPPLPVENTYRMAPKKHFPVEEIRQIIIKTLKNGIGDEDYNKINPARACRILSQLIKDQVKSLDIDRFRVVCVVTIGAKLDEGIRVASRCLWDAQFDRFSSASIENGTLFAVGTVYGIYFE